MLQAKDELGRQILGVPGELLGDGNEIEVMKLELLLTTANSTIYNNKL